MSLHMRLIQIEMYLPTVSSTTELQKALGPLKRFCKDQHNIALSIEPFGDVDRGQFSLIVAGCDKNSVEQESEYLLKWVESQIVGQSLVTDVNWL